MMQDDIENIYSELKDYSEAPPKELWDNIEEKLHPKKKRRGLIWFFGSAAAVLLFFMGYMLIDFEKNSDKPIKTVTDIEHSEQPKEDDQEVVDIKEDTKINSSLEEIDSSNSEDSSFNNSPSKVALQNQDLNKKRSKQSVKKSESQNNYVTNTKSANEIPKSDKSLVQNEVSTETIESKNNTENGIAHQQSKDLIESEKISKVADDNTKPSEEKEKLDISEALANSTTDDDSLKIEKINTSKWSVAVLGGLANTAASQSTIQNMEVNTNSQNDFVYSLKIGYAISDKLTLKSGIGKNVLGQEINNISYASTSGPLATDGSSQSIVDNSSILFFNGTEFGTDISTFEEFSNDGILEQRFDYIQVPLEVSYKFLEKEKYSMSLGAGGNVNFMTNNRAFLNNEEIGENIDVNNTVFGATINSNISYKLTKNTVLFFEPSYNYFQNPIDNNNQSFSNSQLRILFGLQLKL